MRTIARSLIALALAASSSWPGVAAAQKVSFDVRRNVDLTRPKTFAIKTTIPAARPDTRQTTTYDSPFVDEHTNLAIASQLRRRGWTQVDTTPEVYIVTSRTFTTEHKTYAPYWGPYYSPAASWGPYPYPSPYPYANGRSSSGSVTTWEAVPVYAVEEIEGTLTIDLEDAVTHRLLWRGAATKHVYETTDPSVRTKRVDDQVEDIFKKFPPPRR
jgi:hypothetical protein